LFGGTAPNGVTLKVPPSPSGGRLIALNNTTTRAVATDKPAALEPGEEMFAAHEDDAEAARQFTRAMHSASMAPALTWPEKLDLSALSPDA
jgi:hypothetical protein